MELSTLTPDRALPADWHTPAIRQVCRLVNGRGFKPHEWRRRGLPIIRIQNLNGSDEFNYYEGLFDRKIEIEPGQLLFAWSGSRGTSFGPHIWNGPRGVLNYHTWKVVVAADVIDAGFFFHALRKLTAFIEEKAHGASALVHTQKWEMEGFVFPAPRDFREQKAIAQALSDADDLIQSLERLITKKRNLKQAAMQQLLTGHTRLPGFSGEWVTKTFADLFDFSGGYSASREQLTHVGHCYLHYGDIHGTSSTYVDTEADFDSIPKLEVPLSRVNPSSLLNDGDVVFVDASEDVEGTSRHVVVRNARRVPFISGLHTIVAKSKGADLDNDYKRFCFQPEETKRQFRFFAVGTKVSGVSKTNIAKITLRFPDVPEQRAIAEVLSDMDAEITALEARLAKTRDLKQGMMQELLTGRTRLV